MGPAFEYEKYIDFVQERGNFQNIPSTIMATMKQLGIGIFFLLIAAVIQPKYTADLFYQKDFIQGDLLYQYYIMFIVGILARAKVNS